MRFAKHLLRTTVIISISASFLACQDSRARIAISKAQDMQNQIADLDGPDHAEQQINQLQTLISDANSRLDAGETSSGFELANQARDLAETTLAQVEQAEAQDSWDDALNMIDIGDINNLRSRDPNIYTNIENLLKEGEEYRRDSKYREIIRVSRLIIQNVTTGISPVKNEAERARFDAQQKLRELKQQQAQKYDPVSIVNVQDTINSGESRFDERSDYIAATTAFEEAFNLAEQGLNNVKRAKGEEQIKMIEDLVAIANEEGAEEFMLDEYTQLTDDFRKMIVDFNEGRFGRVNNAAEQLLPRADLLKVDTKRAAADNRIVLMRNAIDDLVEAGVEQYLTGRTQPLENVLSEVRDIRLGNTEADFDSIKEMYRDFNTEEERIIAAFQNLTRDEIDKAVQSISKTDGVFSTAKGILDADTDVVPEDMKPFVERRKALRSQLQSDIEQTQTQIGVAQQRLNESKFSSAIEIARTQLSRSESILDNIYDVVSGNSVIELSNLISRYEREGARVYAPSELERSLEDLASVKESRSAGNFIEASEKAASARANIELMEQRISGRAVESIAEARSLFADVAGEKTKLYSANLLLQVEDLLAQSEVELQEERLKIALELAERAKTLAEQAFVQANRLSAEASITSASSAIQKAEQAGAPLYAGSLMESSRQLFGQATQLQTGSNFIKAEELALLAQERATQALYKRINDAESAIADAKAVGGWDQRSDSLSKASSNLRVSRQMIDQGLYDESARLANSARNTAEGVAQSSRQNNYHEAVRRIQDNLAVGTAQGINYFQFEDSVEVRKRLSEIQNEWTIDRYDYIMAELNKLERKLRGTLDTTDDIVTIVAQQQTVRLDNLVELGAVDFATGLVQNARKNLEYAVVDYENGLYKSAHSNLEQAITSINTIENRYNLETYAGDVEALFKRYDEAQIRFRNILSLDPTEIKALAFGSYSRGNSLAIAGQSRPADFRADVEQLYSEAISLVPPSSMLPVHQDVIRALNEGRIAAIRFEKFLILNEASTTEAENLIDTAYANINSSNKVIADLRREFFSNEVEFRLVTYSDVARGN
ncbi:MAG: hypothetical protein ACFCU1_01290 [Sumerlaeia bacterium]